MRLDKIFLSDYCVREAL